MLWPQAGQRQRLPRASAGSAARAALLIVAVAHQQVSAGRPAASAHALFPPHRGQVFSHCSGAVTGPCYSAGITGAIIADSWRGVSMASDEDKGFIDEMADVVPLKRAPRVALRGKTQAERDTSLERRREAAVQGPPRDRNTLTERGIVPLDAWYVMEFKRPGVQNGVFRRLRQGRYESEARLDLHRLTAAGARRELFEFIEESHLLGLRTVLVIHGKGQSRAEQERSSLLKGCTDHWLRELETVQAFASAQPQHGGTGAVYVLLRKSEEKKRENREKFSKGRVPYDPV